MLYTKNKERIVLVSMYYLSHSRNCNKHEIKKDEVLDSLTGAIK